MLNSLNHILSRLHDLCINKWAHFPLYCFLVCDLVVVILDEIWFSVDSNNILAEANALARKNVLPLNTLFHCVLSNGTV